MDYILYFFKFIYRIRWWVILGTTIITVAVLYATRNMPKTYTVEATLYTGVVSGYSIEGEVGNVDWTAANNSMDNLINIIQAESTLKKVAYRLYARNMIHGDLEKDNEFITASSFREIYNRTTHRSDKNAILNLIVKGDEEKTFENILAYEKPDKNNFI